ncbi:hypothetical protein DL764_000412 [Monosporascus ibericus]|uniref:Dioxygenase n=1 Tax=Monosporascus ibericus TaxID=155417 RepID=A0A4Q4TYQ0_9PEZI|nr:hypothetical protein DL764_000412 [Monosporascus ibericus]
MDREARPVRRGFEDEDGDFESVVQKMLEQNFDDWPNEAGFEGLTEVRGPVELTVRGRIPAYAAGTLYRTGPGAYGVEDTPTGTFRITHWFDGFGHTHKFDIIPDSRDPERPMRVEYSSKRQSEEFVETIKKTGNRQQSISFAQRRDPCIGLFGKLMTVWRNPSVKQNAGADNVCVTVQANVPGLPSEAAPMIESGHRSGIKNVWLTTDSCSLKEFDRETLEPIGYATQEKLHPLLNGPLSCAHAQRDPKTGDIFNYNLDMGRYATYRVFRVNASDNKTDILATISAANVKPAYIHSFFLSPSFVILCIPSTHLALMGLKIAWERNIVDAIEPFDQSKLCKWFVIDRIGNRGVVATFESDAGFFFHSINSFEERDEATGDIKISCDLVQYNTLDVIRTFDMDVLLRNDGGARRFWGDETRNRNTHARIVRHELRVPVTRPNERQKADSMPVSGRTEKVLEIKAPHVGELPTINPAFATRKYRYVYSLPNRGHSTLLDSLAKTDLKTRETLYWDNPDGHTPGEAIFVPRPRGSGDEGRGELDEDDGVLFSVVLDGFGRKSYLLCLDAKTMTELGRAECEWPVAFGFHGLHSSTAPLC